MALPTLDNVKAHMNLVGIDDYDSILNNWLFGEIQRAENITGRNFTDDASDDYEVMNDDISNAVLMGVATRFDSRQDNAEGSDSETVNASIFTYRQHSKRPMF